MTWALTSLLRYIQGQLLDIVQIRPTILKRYVLENGLAKVNDESVVPLTASTASALAVDHTIRRYTQPADPPLLL